MKRNKDTIESITKIIAPILTLPGIVVGLWQFNYGQRQNEKIEFKRRMWEKELNTYDELAKITGEILIHAEDSVKFDSLRMEFDRLYYTTMVLSENDSVSELMINTKRELKDFKDGESSHLRLEQRVMLLMDACRLSLAEDWKKLE